MHANESDFPSVVFLHGVGGAAGVWAPQEASFSAAGFAPVALDLPGYGSRCAGHDTGFRGLATDVETTVAERNLPRPVLVGHSLGGMIAQTALRRRPDGYARRCCAARVRFGDPGGAFQRKFVADRLGPLDAGKTLADLAAGNIDDIMGPEPDPAGTRACHRNHGCGARRHLPCGGAMPRRLRRAPQPCKRPARSPRS